MTNIQYIMKHLLFFICTLFASINMAKAQVTISTRDLMGTKWQLAIDYDNQSKDYFEYNQGIKIWHTDDGSTIQYPYYLSKTKPTKFDYTKVGVITEGCYIVATYPKTGDLFCYSINDFYKGNGTMVLENVDSGTENLYILIPSNKPRNQFSKQKQRKEW